MRFVSMSNQSHPWWYELQYGTISMASNNSLYIDWNESSMIAISGLYYMDYNVLIMASWYIDSINSYNNNNNSNDDKSDKHINNNNINNNDNDNNNK